MIWASSQQILGNWDLLRSIWNTHFHCWHFLLLACDDSTLFSVNFRKLRYYWEAFQTLVFIANTFYYGSVMIWTCSQQISENWEAFWTLFFHYGHFLLSACFDLSLFSANFRKLRFCWEAFQTIVFIVLKSMSKDVVETLLRIWKMMIPLVLSKFQKTEILLRSILNNCIHCARCSMNTSSNLKDD